MTEAEIQVVRDVNDFMNAVTVNQNSHKEESRQSNSEDMNLESIINAFSVKATSTTEKISQTVKTTLVRSNDDFEVIDSPYRLVIDPVSGLFSTVRG